MINQTDWMGQIWLVIAQRGRGSKRQRERNRLDSIVRAGAEMLHARVVCVRVRARTERGGGGGGWGSEAPVCSGVAGSNKWNMKEEKHSAALLTQPQPC